MNKNTDAYAAKREAMMLLGGDARQNPYFEPILVDTYTACFMLGIKRTLLFQFLRDGDLERRKIGRKTVVTMESIKYFAARRAV